MSDVQVRLNVCDKVKQTYGSTAWKKWFKTQTEDALDEMEGDDAGLPDNRQSAVPVASPSPRKAPAIAKLERTPAASTAESLKAARDLMYVLVLVPQSSCRQLVRQPRCNRFIYASLVHSVTISYSRMKRVYSQPRSCGTQ